MTFADLAGVTNWQERTHLTEEMWQERLRAAERIAEQERQSTPREWTWLRHPNT